MDLARVSAKALQHPVAVTDVSARAPHAFVAEDLSTAFAISEVNPKTALVVSEAKGGGSKSPVERKADTVLPLGFEHRRPASIDGEGNL